MVFIGGRLVLYPWMKRFPWSGLVITAVAGLAASILLFQAGLPETWTEWLDTNSARVLQVRHVLCFKTTERAAQPELAILHDRYAGPPDNNWHWVNTSGGELLPNWLNWAGPTVPGAANGSSRELYSMLELCLPAKTPRHLNAQGIPEDLNLPQRLSPTAQRALMNRALKVVELSHSPKAGADYAYEVFQISLAHARVEPEDLPAAEGFSEAWLKRLDRGY